MLMRNPKHIPSEDEQLNCDIGDILIPTSVLRDKRLSLEQRGIYAYFISECLESQDGRIDYDYFVDKVKEGSDMSKHGMSRSEVEKEVLNLIKHEFIIEI